MKKIIVFLFVVVLSASLFATTSASNLIKKDLLNTQFNVVGVTANADIYHASAIMASETGSEIISGIMHGKVSSDISNLLMLYLINLTPGTDSIVGANAGLGVSIKNYGFAFDASAIANSKAGEVVSADTLAIVPVAKGSLSFVYARKIYEDNVISLDASAVGHINTVLISDAISYNTVKSGFDVKNLSGYAGLGLPVDLRANVAFKNGINCDVGFDNLFATYFVDKFDNTSKIAGKLFGFGSEKYKESWNLNTGAEYSIGNSWITGSFFTRFNNVNTYFTKNCASNFKKNIDLGAAVNVKDIFQLELGIYGGYFGSTMSVGYNNNRFNLSYGWKESGEKYGEAPVDFLSIGMIFGWKK